MLRYFCQRAAKCSLQERLQQVATCTMMRVVVLLNLVLLLLILVVDMVLLDMSHRVCVLLLLFVALCCYVFLITWISGHWNEQKQRMQLSPILSILVVILLFSCVIAFWQHVYGGVPGWSAYIFPLCIATTTMIMAIIIGILERRYR